MENTWILINSKISKLIVRNRQWSKAIHSWRACETAIWGTGYTLYAFGIPFLSGRLIYRRHSGFGITQQL